GADAPVRGRSQNDPQDQTYPQGNVAAEGNDKGSAPVPTLDLDGPGHRALRAPCRRTSRPLHAETSNPPYRHIPSANVEGTTRWPQAEHEPDRGGDAANYPVGDKARRIDAVVATRADPGRDVGTKGILNTFPRWQTVSGPGMTRTSFVAASKAYLTAMRPYYRPSTLEWWRRNFTTIRADLEALIEDGSIKRTTPSQIGDKDIEALLLRWRERLDVSTQEKYLMTLAGLLEWCGNPVVSIMRKRKHVRFPHGPAKPIRVLGPDELARIRAAIEALDGWSGSVARFLVGFLPCTGLRPKEFRLAGLKDIDLTKGRILVAHPKGEQAWASADFAPIPPMARPVLEDFLAERADYLEGRECEWLVPYVRMSGEIGPWSDAM